MRVKSLKIAVVNGIAVSIGDILELDEKVAKIYIESGFVEELKENLLVENNKELEKQEQNKKSK